MTPEIQSLIDQLRDHMANSTNEQRGEIYDALTDGYTFEDRWKKDRGYFKVLVRGYFND